MINFNFEIFEKIVARFTVFLEAVLQILKILLLKMGSENSLPAKDTKQLEIKSKIKLVLILFFVNFVSFAGNILQFFVKIYAGASLGLRGFGV
jgi:hypothetical protein